MRPPRPLRHRNVLLDMLAEAVHLIRRLWTGEMVDHDGEHYVVENARIYTLPRDAPNIYVSAFGPKAIEVAARIADGFITTQPSSEDLVAYRQHGGTGQAEERHRQVHRWHL